MCISGWKTAFAAIAITSMSVCAGISLAVEGGAGNSQSRTTAKAATGEASGPDDELEYDDGKLANDLFIIDRIYNRVKFREVKKNVSMGLTSEGLNFRVGW